MHRLPWAANHIFLGIICLLLSAFCMADQPKKSDVRVVIDISGSMKKTDPTNLRKPAVDLIVRLLPNDSKAGIWTFGQSVNMLVAHRTVNDDWRKEAVEKAESINSIALYTNIGAALEKSSAIKTAPGYETHIILLTDGVVDINPEAVVNMKERSRILKEILPDIKNAQFKIHTISLSDAADQELMKKLSLATDGVNQVAKSADELMSTFLRIFDQAVPAERVPLDEEGFLVDASVEEFTALIFRKSDDEKTLISDPEGKTFETTDPKNNVNWYRAKNYDLITVQNPLAGKWKVMTAMAPNSRVTVVSDLSLQVKPSANNLKRNQPLTLTYQFTEGDKTITKPEFLNLLSADILLAHNDEKTSRSESISFESIPENGVFQYTLDGMAQAGDYDLKLTVDGKTFRREFTHHFSVVDQNFKLEKSLNEEEGKKTYSYRITADRELVDTEKTTAKVIVKNSQQNDMEKELKIIDGDHWELVFSPVQTAKYSVSFVMDGAGLDGAPIQETLLAEEFYYPDEASVKADEAARAAQAAEKEKIEKEKIEEVAVDEVEVAPEPEEVKTEEATPWVLYSAIGLANLLLIGLGYLAYKLLLGKKGEGEIDEIEKTLNLDIKDIKASAQKSAPKTVIDVSEENEAHIPIKDTPKTADESMAENLFPLESLDESDDKK
jgi:uncharacterized protein (TIGR03503 family)